MKMPLSFLQKRSGRLPAFLSISVPLAGFILILISLNVYQYFKAKQNIAATNLIELSRIEISGAQGFFKSVTTRLQEVREWGKNGLLEVDNEIELNKKMFPLMTSNNLFTALLLAESTGSEYYLTRKEGNLLTRKSIVGKNETTMAWRQWGRPDQTTSKWEEKSDYDPRKRPWFVTPQATDTINWTEAYIFFQSGKPGITASVSWVDPENPQKYTVFGLDFLTESITDLLTTQGEKRNTLLFWLNAEKPYYSNSISPGTDAVEGQGMHAPREKIIQAAIDAWKTEGRLSDKVIPFVFDREKWLVHIKHLDKDTSPVLIGVAAPEKVLAAELKSILLKIDGTDLLVGVIGGLFLILLAWRFGWRVTTSTRRQLNPDDLIKLIAEGENAHLEFKSTVRFNLRSGKAGKEIELAWLKAVTAFLNTGGGTLLIGVADDGTILGTESDNFENDDRCLLHVKNLVNQHIGAEYSGFLSISLTALNGCRLVVVNCRKSSTPVFLKTGKNEEFYIRSGPSNTKLTPSQLISYLEKNR